jgi:putative thioredoxin
MSVSASPYVFDVGEVDFEQKVIQASADRPVLVDFWAQWCQPCRVLSPVLEKAVNGRGGALLLAKVNVDDNQNLAAAFRIEGIPAVKVIHKGQVIHEFTGVVPEASLNHLLDQLMPSEADNLTASAQAREATDPAGAEHLYRQALAQDSRQLAARIGLARVLLAQDQIEEISDLLDPVGTEGELGAEAAGLVARATLLRLVREQGGEQAVRQRFAAEPDSPEHRYQMGCVLAARGELEPALEMLLSAGEKDFRLAGSKVREAMVQVFYLLGVQHPLANDYRARLTRLLY